MKYFKKEFENYEIGLAELMKVSFSAEQALNKNGRTSDTLFKKLELSAEIPSEVAAMKSLVFNVLDSAIHPNDSDRSDSQIEIYPGYVSYTTTSGLTFGWKASAGPHDDDYHDKYGQYIFFINHPFADEDSAAPVDSSLRKSAIDLGWIES